MSTKTERMEDGEWRGIVNTKLDFISKVMQETLIELKEMKVAMKAQEEKIMLIHRQDIHELQVQLEELKMWKNRLLGVGVFVFPVVSLLINYLFDKLTS